MIEYKTGDIFEANVEAVVNTVNCVGVMGRGIALQFKNRFPENFKAYAKACKKNEVNPGKMFVFDTGNSVGPRYVINFPTKRHWRSKSRIEDIDAGIAALIDIISQYNIHSIAIPPLGSGLGGLSWDSVKPRIETAFGLLNHVQVIVYEPVGNSNSRRVSGNTSVPKMTPGRAALVELMNRYLNGMLDPFVTLLEVHKLMYFMQEAGQQLKLNYQKATYGPYAENLRHVLQRVEGYFITGYLDGGDLPSKKLELVEGAAESASKILNESPAFENSFQRVARLIEGFESPFGMELLSTVHWVVTQEGARTLDDVADKVYKWNKHKEKFTRRQITIAVETLAKQSWIEELTIS